MSELEKEENPIHQDISRNPDGTFKEGVSGNPAGRPKGKTLKEWARDKLMGMTEEERESFIKTLPKDIVWRMAEGNPHQATDITSAGKQLPTPILGYVQDNHSHEESSESQ